MFEIIALAQQAMYIIAKFNSNSNFNYNLSWDSLISNSPTIPPHPTHSTEKVRNDWKSKPNPDPPNSNLNPNLNPNLNLNLKLNHILNLNFNLNPSLNHNLN